MKATKLFVTVPLLLLLLAALSVSAIAGPSSQPALQEEPQDKIDKALLEALSKEDVADFIVVMVEQADLSDASQILDRSSRGWHVYETLQQVAAHTQAGVVDYATAQKLAYRSFLTTNSVLIEKGDLKAAQEIAELEQVKLVRLPFEISLDPIVEPSEPGVNSYGWNLDTLDPGSGQYGMQAAQVWAQHGLDGEGIIVANIDTGVYYQHVALDRQYRGNLSGNLGGPYDHDYNWYMPTYGCDGALHPCDNHSHGSGTMGIMVGETPDLTEQIGVAPGAKWIACKGCESSGCSETALTACADWMLAPCPIGVAPGDPSCDPDMRPHIVNNSWGGSGCNTWYQPYVQAWVASGIFPAFSAGNSPYCNGLGSPGDLPESFGTAAHNTPGINLYAGGPSCFFPNPSCDPEAHQVDPHLNAPTYGRTSSNSQGAYYNLGGTSGASPHTAGTVALIWQANPNFIDEIYDTYTVLEQSTNHNVPEGDCGKPSCAGSNPYPNYEYGWGYLDALAAVNMVDSNTCVINLVNNTHNCQYVPAISFVLEPTNSKTVFKVNLEPALSGYTSAIFDVLYGGPPNDWTVNIGDSRSNNGYGGDAVHQSNDAEMQIRNTTLGVWGNDYLTLMEVRNMLNLYNIVSQGDTVSIEVSNYYLGWQVGQRIGELRSQYLYALDGQPDNEGPINYDIYAAFNRSIYSYYRYGSGVTQVTVTLYP